MIRIGAFATLIAAAAVSVPSVVSGQTASFQDRHSIARVAEESADRLASAATLPGPRFPHRVTGSTFDTLDTFGTLESRSRPTVVPPQERDRGGIPYMVAGGVLFVGGAIAGGDAGGVLMLGGAGIGAYGAYVYFGGGEE